MSFSVNLLSLGRQSSRGCWPDPWVLLLVCYCFGGASLHAAAWIAHASELAL